MDRECDIRDRAIPKVGLCGSHDFQAVVSGWEKGKGQMQVAFVVYDTAIGLRAYYMPCGVTFVDETVTVIGVCRPGIVQGRKVEADVVLPVIELEMFDVGRGLWKKRMRVGGIL